VANNIAELLVAWRNFRQNVVEVAKDLKDVSKAVRTEVSLSPIKQYAKEISDKNAILRESYSSLAERIAGVKKRIQESTNVKDIEVLTKNLEKMGKAAAKHPGNADNAGKEKGGGVLGAVGGLLGKLNPMGLIETAIGSAIKNEKPHPPAPPPDPGQFVKNPMKMSMDGSGLGKMGLEATKQKDSGTVAEKLETFNGKIDDAIGQVGVAFMPMMNQLMEMALQLSDTLLPMIMQAIQPLLDMINQIPIADIFNSVLNVAVAIIAAVGPILEQLTPLFSSIFEMLGPLIQEVGGFIVVLVEGLAPILALVAHIIAAVLGPALVLVGKILGVIIDIIKWVAKIALAILKPIIDFIALLIDGIMWLFGQSNKFSGKGADGKPKTLTPPNPEKDSKVSALDAGAQLDKGLAATATTTTPVTVNTGKTKPEKAANKTAGEIAGGGPRVININGVKFAEKIELSVINAKEGINHLEAQLQEMFLRILNSGAVLQ
jgi:hypothetical protein